MNTPGAGVSSGGGGGFVADGATVHTSVATTSATYTDLTASPGPAVTIVVTGTRVVVQVAVGCCNNSGSGFNGFVGVDVAGPTTQAASDNFCGTVSGSGAGLSVNIVADIVITGLTAGGTYTFTLKYRCNGQNWQFYERDMRVILL